MSPMAALATDNVPYRKEDAGEIFLTQQLAACASAASGLIESGLAARDGHGEAAAIARAYEAALVAGLSPAIVRLG